MLLNAMRQGATSPIFKVIIFGIILLAVGGLALSGGRRFSGNVHRTAIAKIDGQDIPVYAFDRTLRRTLNSQGLDLQTAYKLGFVQQVLANMVSQNLIQKAAFDMGLQVDNNEVLKQVDKLVAPLVTKDMTKKQALQAVLRNQGLSEQDFVHMVKAEMTTTLLRNAIQAGTAVPPKLEGDDLYQYNKEQRTVNTIFLKHSAITDIDKPKDEILLPFYEAGKERYAIPETRTFTIAVLTTDKLAKTLDISDEELKQTYERDIDTYKEPEKRKLDQVIVDNQAAATAIANDAKAGQSLKDAVKKETDNEKAYLGTQEFEKAGLLKELGDAVFAAKKGDVIGPIQSSLGWHVVKLESIVPPSTKPFAEVKDSLKKELLQGRVADQMYELSNQVDDSLAGGASLEDVADQMDMKLTQYGPVKADGTTADSKDGLKALGDDRDTVLSTVKDMMEGEVSPVMELSDGSYAAIRVDKITEKSYKPFDEVKKDLAKVWEQDQREVGNKLKAVDAIKALNMGDKTLKQIAAENKVSISTVTLVRGEDAKAPLDNKAKTAFFDLPVGSFGVSLVKDGYIIGEVKGSKLPDVAKAKDEDVKSFIDVAERGAQGEMMQLYFAALQSHYKVKINTQLLTETYGPGKENY